MASSDSFRFLALKAVAQTYSVKKVFLEISQNLQENTFARVCFTVNFIEKETLAQIFSYEFCKLFKGTVMEMEKGLINDRLRVSKVS